MTTKNSIGALIASTVFIALLVGLSFKPAVCAPKKSHPILSKIKLPPGFHISIYADKVPNARSMTRGTKGTIFVSTRNNGAVYALVDTNKDHKVDKVYTLLTGLNMPNGVAFRNGSLYIAEIHRVIRLDKIEEKLAKPPKPVVVNGTFPNKTHHGWKFIRFGPDGKLYVPVGAPCNVCKKKDKRYGTIMRMNPDGTKLEVFAKGVRNSVGFDWHPKTKALWFTDNGRDWLGNNLPPDELNHAPKKGMHFGFPHCHGGYILDPKFGKGHKCSQFTPPVQRLGPHVASLGMRFYTGKMFPAAYRNQIFIAEHGSWNRTTLIGYRVTLVKLKGNKAVSYTPFAYGWLQGRKRLGRPVDLLQLPDGSLLISDDYRGKIYRITYRAPRPVPPKRR